MLPRKHICRILFFCLKLQSTAVRLYPSADRSHPQCPPTPISGSFLIEISLKIWFYPVLLPAGDCRKLGSVPNSRPRSFLFPLSAVFSVPAALHESPYACPYFLLHDDRPFPTSCLYHINKRIFSVIHTSEIMIKTRSYQIRHPPTPIMGNKPFRQQSAKLSRLPVSTDGKHPGKYLKVPEFFTGIYSKKKL